MSKESQKTDPAPLVLGYQTLPPVVAVRQPGAGALLIILGLIWVGVIGSSFLRSLRDALDFGDPILLLWLPGGVAQIALGVLAWRGLRAAQVFGLVFFALNSLGLALACYGWCLWWTPEWLRDPTRLLPGVAIWVLLAACIGMAIAVYRSLLRHDLPPE